MNIQSINNNQNNPGFKGIMKPLVKNAGLVAALAGSSVVAQKIVMSGSEAVVGPMIDIGVGKTITKITDEKDGKTNDSSKVQAIRTFSQSVGGTIVGVIMRLSCIALMTAILSKIGQSAGKLIGKEATKKDGVFRQIADTVVGDKALNAYEYEEKMKSWGKSTGGGIAVLIMLVTNFIIDAPFINWINGKMTNIVNNIQTKKQNKIAQNNASQKPKQANKEVG